MMSDILANNKQGNANAVDNGQTPVRMSIATPNALAQQGYFGVINFNDVKSATATHKTIIATTTITNGIIRRPVQPPNSDSSSDGGGNGNAPYINNVGLGNGGQGHGGGDDELGDIGIGSGKGQMGKRRRIWVQKVGVYFGQIQ